MQQAAQKALQQEAVERVGERGQALLNNPVLNKGTAFTRAERHQLGVEGLLPTRVETLAEQCARSRYKYDRLHDDLERHIFLRAMQDTNQVLFYAFVERHLNELMPILYTPTVGRACQEFSHIYRRPLGVFLSYPDRDHMAAQLAAFAASLTTGPAIDGPGTSPPGVDVAVVTDGERILGLGDQGIGGMGIPIGKLALYTAAGGVDPARTLPIILDVGTNNQELLDDPLYLGWRHERIAGAEYDSFIEQFVSELFEQFPSVLLQWEDFASVNAAPLLDRYRDRVLSFNDDIQGTAAVALAAINAAVVAKSETLAEQTVCIVGAGSAGTGIASMLLTALAEDGVADPSAQVFLVDADGLLHSQRTNLEPFQQPYAQPFERVAAWVGEDGPAPLESIVANTAATVLVGVSGQQGLFTEPVVKALSANAERPVVMPLSNPTSHAEATPTDLMAWTNGQALIATGSPFEPVQHDGVSHTISQSNNVYVFPGLGQGALVVDASRISDAMLSAAARAVADPNPDAVTNTAAGVLPPLEDVPTVSRRIALAVANAAVAEGLGTAGLESSEVERRLDARWWHPVYNRMEAE